MAVAANLFPEYPSGWNRWVVLHVSRYQPPSRCEAKSKAAASGGVALAIEPALRLPVRRTS